MGSNWQSIDNQFPTFTGHESLKDQVRLIHDFLPVMIEGLKYQLNNLDANNWNTKARADFQKDTTADLEQAVDVTDKAVLELIAQTEALLARAEDLERRLAAAETDIAYLDLAQEGLAQQMGTLEGLVDAVCAELDAIGEVLVPDDTGVTLGAEGLTVKLVGTVTVNGTPLS